MFYIHRFRMSQKNEYFWELFLKNGTNIKIFSKSDRRAKKAV